MKKNSVIVNTSRGGIIDENSLYEALNSKLIKGAGMDVFESEPPSSDHPFFNLDNILLTPHNAALTLECRERMSLEASENIANYLKKHGWNRDGVIVKKVQLNNKKDLLIYSYRVAGTVGLMMAKILNVKDQNSVKAAIDLGIAMQLTNIARDVVEDEKKNRTYY